nr:MAG TPA: hypothetical protein [Caudoviricetes sp.]
MVKNLIAISKAEAQELRKILPNVEIHKTLRTKSGRGKYYLVEEKKNLIALAKLRNVSMKSITE